MNAFDLTRAWAEQRGHDVVAVLETDSTNRAAKDAGFDAETARTNEAVSTPSIFLTARQTAGRGRGSNSWIDASSEAPGASLLSSWSFTLQRAPQPILSALVGLALFEAAHATWPELALNLKAPNDLYIHDRKLAGLLIETVTMGSSIRTVVGLGLNAGASPSNVPTATSLAEHLSTPLSRGSWERFLESWFDRLVIALTLGQESSLSPESCARLTSALNRHPLLKEPVLRVDELGQLHFSSRTVHWYEL